MRTRVGLACLGMVDPLSRSRAHLILPAATMLWSDAFALIWINARARPPTTATRPWRYQAEKLAIGRSAATPALIWINNPWRWWRDRVVGHAVRRRHRSVS